MGIDSNLLILMVLSISAAVISIACCIISVFSLLYSMKAHVAVLAMEKSTHTVTYAPVDKEIDEANKAWSTQQDTLDKDHKKFKEDIEDQMPEFQEEDEDKKVYSF